MMQKSSAIFNILARRIKVKRKELGLTQTRLAEMASVSNPQMFRYENGDNMPTADVIVRLAKALQTTPNWLLGFDDLEDEGLTDEEVEILRLFRSKSPERYEDILEIMRRV